jgi:hypothetical protein
MSDPYAKAAYDRRYGGTIIADGKEIGNTAQCKHCGDHFLMIRGSGAIRGWCTRCNGFVCGPKCATCIPFEVQLDIMEGKYTSVPIQATVPRTIGG